MATVSKLKTALDTFNSLTGRSGRHNRALRDVVDWSGTVQEFLARYSLQTGSTSYKSIFENMGEAKVDLTTIAHKARTVIKTAEDIRGKKFPPLIEEVLDDIDATKRALINPSAGRIVIKKIVPALQE
ncbi:hypothetical protein ACFLW9_04510, partial [Chloroflexota bacterium]